MKIKKINIENWRSIKNLSAEINDFSVIIGQNNHGKSNIISALLFFFGKIKPNEQDFLDSNEPAKIEISFDNLDENDKTTFQKYLSANNTIKVQKILNNDLKFSYHGYLQLPQEEWLNPSNSSNYTSRESVSDLPINEILPQSGRLTKAIIETAQMEYIEQNKTELSFNYILETSNFLGLKTVAQGIFGDVYFIPAIKNATDELKPNGSSVFSELYSKILNKLAETNSVYQNAKQQVSNLVSILNKTDNAGLDNPNRPTELNTFEANIAEELNNWNTLIEVEITPPNIDDVFKVGTKVWVNDGVKTDVDRKGNGLQRALIFALIKAYSKIVKNENEASQDDLGNRTSSNSSFFIIEEPELFLHPQAQRDLYQTLKTLSQNNNQVIVTTHSNSFVDIENYKSLIIAQKTDVISGTTVKQCSTELFSGLNEKKKINLIYWINPERSELFFAKKVILVEGQTDKTILPFLAKKLNVYSNEFTIIDCASKDNLPLYIKLLNGFKLNYIAVYDKDHQAHKGADAINSANTSSESIENVIDLAYGKSIVLVNDIEEEIGILETSNKNKPFVALNKVSEESYVLPETLKNKVLEMFT